MQIVDILDMDAHPDDPDEPDDLKSARAASAETELKPGKRRIE